MCPRPRQGSVPYTSLTGPIEGGVDASNNAMAKPVLKDGEVFVRVHAVSGNPWIGISCEGSP